jgi:hypothetical protein
MFANDRASVELAVVTAMAVAALLTYTIRGSGKPILPAARAAQPVR